MKLFSTTGLGLATAMAAGLAMPAAAETELTMYYPIAVGGALTEVVDGIVADFETANPDIKVNAIYSGNYDDTRVRALSALASGEPAQLAVMFSIDAYDLIEQELVIPFEDVASTDADKEWLSSFYPALMANGKIEGKTWGIPFQRSTIVAYYNKDLFRAAGLDPEAPPTTWDEMIQMGKALTKDDTYGLMIPSTGYPYWMFQALAIQNGKEVMSGDGLTTYFDDPTVVETLEFWKSLSAEHGIMPTGTVEWGTLRQAFLEGQTAMMWHSTGNLTAVKKGASFDFGVAELPANVRKGSPTGGGNFYLFKDTTDEERVAALKLMQFMTAPDQAAAWSIGTGYMGVSPAAYETEALQAYTAEFPPALVARNQLENAVAEFSTFETARVRDGLNNAIQSALTGAKEPAEALAEAQAAAMRLLKDYQ
jgi:sn-glycerol 3-phosphate transport system substrate-binding protein